MIKSDNFFDFLDILNRILPWGIHTKIYRSQSCLQMTKKSGKLGAGISVKLFENGLSNNASEHVLLFHLDKNGLLHLSQNYTLNLSQPDPKLSQGAQPAVLMSCENLTIVHAISKFFTKATW